MEKSASIKNIGLALLKFHGIMQGISKDAKNPAFKKDGKVSKYASLSNIQDAIRQPLQDVGLVYLQMPEIGNTMVTMLMHPESEEYIQGTYDLTPVSNSPQAVGSAITYARRYALGAILGLTIDEDDDGNAASGTDGKEPEKKVIERKWLTPNTPEWTKAIAFLKNPEATISQIKAKYDITTKNEELLKNEIINN
jgi:hypothetical protein